MSGYYILNGGTYADISNVLQYRTTTLASRLGLTILGKTYSAFNTSYNAQFTTATTAYRGMNQFYADIATTSSSSQNPYMTGFKTELVLSSGLSSYIDFSTFLKIRTVFINSNFNTNNNIYFIYNDTNFTVTSDCMCEIICVGGGGAGGGSSNSYAGGGGANTMICIASLKTGITYSASIAQQSTDDGQDTILSSSDDSITITAKGGQMAPLGSTIGILYSGGLGGIDGSAIGDDIVSFNSYKGNRGGGSNNRAGGRGEEIIEGRSEGVVLNSTSASLNYYYMHDQFNITFATSLTPTLRFGRGGGGANTLSSANGANGTYGNGGEGSTSTVGLGGPGCIYLNPFTSTYVGSTKISFTKDSLDNMPIITQATRLNTINVGLDYYTFPELHTSNATAGTLYTYETSNTSAEATFTLNSGTMVCYVVLVGPGGWGTSLTPSSGLNVTGGAGGGIISARFVMTVGETYTIHLDPGTNNTTDGTTSQGFVDISSNTFKLTAYGGNITSLYTNSGGIPGGTTSITNTGSGTIYSAVSYGGNSGYVTSTNVKTSATDGALVFNTNTVLTGHTIPLNIQSDIKSQIIVAHKSYVINKQNIVISNNYITFWPVTTKGTFGDLVQADETDILNGFSGGGGGSNTPVTLTGSGRDAYYAFWNKAFTNLGSDWLDIPRTRQIVYNSATGYGTGGNSAFRLEPDDPNNVSQLLGGKGGAGAVMIYLSRFST